MDAAIYSPLHSRKGSRPCGAGVPQHATARLGYEEAIGGRVLAWMALYAALVLVLWMFGH